MRHRVMRACERLATPRFYRSNFPYFLLQVDPQGPPLLVMDYRINTGFLLVFNHDPMRAVHLRARNLIAYTAPSPPFGDGTEFGAYLMFE